jgi:hypothetical protein
LALSYKHPVEGITVVMGQEASTYRHLECDWLFGKRLPVYDLTQTVEDRSGFEFARVHFDG